MRTPIVYQASEIVNWHVSEEYAPGKWRPARCCGFWDIGQIKQQFKLAWAVFWGRYDVLNWGERSGEGKSDTTNYRDCTESGWVNAAKKPVEQEVKP
jgi:hypothetical protein